MIYSTYIFCIGGIGQIIKTNPSKSDKLNEDLLISGFLSAIRGFSHEIYEELKSISFVTSKMVLLPSNDLYVLSVHASHKYNESELIHYLEIIRDYINENFWEEIHQDIFFSDSNKLENHFKLIVKDTIEKEEWVKCKQ